MTSASQIISDLIDRRWRTRTILPAIPWIETHYRVRRKRIRLYGYQKPIAFVFSDLDTPQVFVRKGTQIGLTELGNAVTLHEATERARSVGVYLPRNKDLLQYVGVMLTPALRAVQPARDAMLVQPDQKHPSNTNDRKDFDGVGPASIFMRCADVMSSYDSISFDTGIQDEASRHPYRIKINADAEGESPFKAISSRMDAAKHPKQLAWSSPEEAGSCAITELYESAQYKMQQHIPCPHCDHYQPLEWGASGEFGMQWDRVTDAAGNRDNFATSRSAWYQCRACHGRIEYQDMIDLDDERGQLRSEDVTDPDTGEIIQPAIGLSLEDECYYVIEHGELTDRVADKPHSIGIHQNSMFSRTKSWQDAVFQYLNAIDALKVGDTSEMATFEKRYLAKPYAHSQTIEVVDWKLVKPRAERYITRYDDKRTEGVPNDVLAVFAWYDLQNDWIHGGAIGYDADDECWWLRNMISMGDPETTRSLDAVNDMLDHKFIRQDGTVLQSILIGIDSGDRPTLAYRKSMETDRTRVIPTKGSSNIGHPVALFPKSPKPNCMHTFMTMIGPTTVKDRVFSMIKKVEEPGPGYVHFPDTPEFDDDFYKGLMSEKKKLQGGVMKYDKIHQRNEPLDIMVGCEALYRVATDPIGMYRISMSGLVHDLSEKQTDDQETDKTASSIAKRWRKT